jgi:type I restriction enzyme M protein
LKSFAYTKQYGGDETRIRRRLERERFVLPKGASYYDLYEQRNEPNIGELINTALEKIEDTNRTKLEGVFRNIDFNSESNLGRVKDRNRRLKNLLEDFAKPALDLRPSRVTEDIIGECYIYLISRFASDAGKKAGEFYTPSAVSGLLAKLASPKPGDTICDPACGSGSLLVQASKEVGSENFALFGQEVNGATWALARMNMFLHSKDAARIEWCDTLNSPALIDGDHLTRFDVVLANPPFSLDKWGAESAPTDAYNRFWRGIPPKSKGDYAFISHMIEIARRQSGRVAVIVPHGVLFRGGAEGAIRKAFIEENLLDAVVGLPANLFTTTGIPVAILVFDRSREDGGANEARKDVLFIDASKEFTSDKTQNMMDETHIAMRDRLTGISQKLLGKDGAFPEQWKLQSLSEVATRIQRQNGGSNHPVMTISAKSGFLMQSDKFSRDMAGTSVERYIVLHEGEFAYNKGNSLTAPYGCIFSLDRPSALVPFVYFCFALNGDLSRDFFIHLFAAGALNHQLSRLINSGVRNDGLLNLNPDDFFGCKVPVPPADEQTKIASTLTTAKHEIALVERELDALSRQKRGLMQKLLIGEWRVAT